MLFPFFSQDSGVEIAAMDATAHTPPGMYKVQVNEQTIINCIGKGNSMITLLL